MTKTRRRQFAHMYWIRLRSRFAGPLILFSTTAFYFLGFTPVSLAQNKIEVRRTFTVPVAQPLTLDVEIDSGDLQILYGRDGQVSLSGSAKAFGDVELADSFFVSALTVEQQGNNLKIRHAPNPASPQTAIRVHYRIDVPYRTQLIANLKNGDQNISGILGPVQATASKGDIKASYVSSGVKVRTEQGNLDLQVIGEYVEAKTASGNIVCARAAQGISAETGRGDINFIAVGPSQATVVNGTGRIDVEGAFGSFVGSTNAGDVHIRAVPRGNWQLHSATGNIRVELPPDAKFELDATSNSGKLIVDRDDIERRDDVIRYLHHEVKGSSAWIDAHSDSGNIIIR